MVDTYENGGNKIIDQMEEAHEEGLKEVHKQQQPVQERRHDLSQALRHELEEGRKALGGVQSAKHASSAREKKVKQLQCEIEKVAGGLME